MKVAVITSQLTQILHTSGKEKQLKKKKGRNQVQQQLGISYLQDYDDHYHISYRTNTQTCL